MGMLFFLMLLLHLESTQKSRNSRKVRPEDPAQKKTLQGTGSERSKEKRPYGDIRVIMYMTSWCPYCAKARNFLRSLGVHLIEYDIERDKEKGQEMLSKSGGSTGVPLIDVEGGVISWYNPDALKAAIEKRRDL